MRLEVIVGKDGFIRLQYDTGYSVATYCKSRRLLYMSDHIFGANELAQLQHFVLTVVANSGVLDED